MSLDLIALRPRRHAKGGNGGVEDKGIGATPQDAYTLKVHDNNE